MNRDKAGTRTIDQPKESGPRLAALDGLRLIAALAVAVFHFGAGWPIDGVNTPAYFLPSFAPVAIYGFLGVELFFLISGFVIGMSSWRRSLGSFFVSRVSRLYPAYWVCILITATVVTLVPISGGLGNDPVNLGQIAVNMTMLQEPLGVTAVDAVYWTLFVELRFYLLFAVVVAFGLTYRRTVIFCAAWMAVAVIGPTMDSRIVSVIAIPEYAPYFIAGITMFMIHKFGPSPLLLAMAGFSWLVSIKRVGDRVAGVNPGFEVPTWPGVLIITLAYLAVLVIALGWTDRIRWSWLTTAGVLTYPFYLLHARIGYAMIRKGHENLGLPAWALIAGAIAVLLVLAWLVHRLVERRLTTWLRDVLRGAVADVRRISATEAAAAAEEIPGQRRSGTDPARRPSPHAEQDFVQGRPALRRTPGPPGTPPQHSSGRLPAGPRPGSRSPGR